MKKTVGILFLTVLAFSLFAQARVLSVRTDAINEEGVFSHIADALKVARSGDEINIYEGVYHELGLMVPDGVTLTGIGSVTIAGELPADVSTEVSDNTSTIDLFHNGNLRNLTVTARNMRYPVHSDFSRGNTVQKIENCRFIHYGNHEMYQYRLSSDAASPNGVNDVFRAQSAWGGGTKAGDKRCFSNCYFESPVRAFSVHNNVDFHLTYGASFTSVENCVMISHGTDLNGDKLGFTVPVHIQSLQSNSPDKIILKNCKINGYLCFQNSPTFEVFCNTPGLKTIFNTAGASKQMKPLSAQAKQNLSFYVKNPIEIKNLTNTDKQIIRRGQALKRHKRGIALMTSCDKRKQFMGVAMQDIEPGKSGDVKYRGFLLQDYFRGLEGIQLSDGQQIGVDEIGNFSPDSQFRIAVVSDHQNILIIDKSKK
ncbi:hypothetical protein SDC9_49454 [bioreactor metagenome]|uniref:Right handed beta helix domain-containing protein n=1 Tax=bioreactor metagenome TaxID=1076179 RepID=A0A644WHE8_9ZZZZ|nr:hypothetical protein [Paludibacter sp.]